MYRVSNESRLNESLAQPNTLIFFPIHVMRSVNSKQMTGIYLLGFVVVVASNSDEWFYTDAAATDDNAAYRQS